MLGYGIGIGPGADGVLHASGGCISWLGELFGSISLAFTVFFLVTSSSFSVMIHPLQNRLQLNIVILSYKFLLQKLEKTLFRA
jgi:hypothetical protein